MEQTSSQLTPEMSSLLYLLASHEPECGVLGVSTGTNGHQRIPGVDHSFDEVALWEEFEVIKRSAEWHVGQYLKFWDRCEKADGDPAALGHSKRRNQLDESLFKSNGSKDRWRLKVEHDKAIRDLLTVQRILNILVADEERITGYRCMKKALA
ncbi:hypothetical protein MKX08_000140 [Trichoderma sp. CBMAI-0020]|nr:hypothetical protein MKX08_000140 [Trichoderma sp. CBMAI-0020]